MKTRNLGYLLSTASVVAFAYAGAISAEPFGELSISDYADFGSTYENSIDVNFDTIDSEVEIESFNDIIAEGALGASNVDVNQVAFTQFVNVAAQTDSENDTIIDLSHDFSHYDSSQNMELRSSNTAAARTSVFDAIIGGSQVAVTSFNTASLDIDAVGEDSSAEVALLQEIDADWAVSGLNGYDMKLSASNRMEAAALMAGTATIDSLSDGENGVQQAALSVNTFNLSSEVDTTIELAGQQFDPRDFLDGEDGDGDLSFRADNIAVAYAPRPATSEYVDPRLATDLNDPSVNNLDQIAAISINTMSFGNAANAEEEIAASTADFQVLSYSDSDSDFEANGQDVVFDNGDYDLTLGNAMVATTLGEDFFFLADNQGFGEDFGGYGDVAIDSGSQVTALTINSITNAGQGGLTLKEVYAFGGEDVLADQGDFDQEVDGLDYQAGIENLAIASTGAGDANVSNLEQTAQYSFNSISSGGDLNGWNDGDENNGISQEIDIDFRLSEGLDIPFGEFFPFGVELGLNTASARSIDNAAALSDVRQVSQLSMNTISVDGNMTAGLDQGIVDRDLVIEDNVNVLSAIGLGLGEDYNGGASIDSSEQVALFNFNTLSVDGVLDSDQLDQEFDADDVEIYASLNDADSNSVFGDATASGISQIAQMTFNSVAAGSLAGAGSSIDQSFEDLNNVDDFANANTIDAAAVEQGNAIVADSSQAFILNANSVSFDNAVNGEISQNLEDLDLASGGANVNATYAFAYQDAGDARWMGGNASIDGLTQSLAISMNTISAGSMGGVNISQYSENIDINVGNSAYADAEYGVASITGVTQQTINRINSISITPVSIN
jgi:hypothetical protein